HQIFELLSMRTCHQQYLHSLLPMLYQSVPSSTYASQGRGCSASCAANSLRERSSVPQLHRGFLGPSLRNMAWNMQYRPKIRPRQEVPTKGATLISYDAPLR